MARYLFVIFGALFMVSGVRLIDDCLDHIDSMSGCHRIDVTEVNGKDYIRGDSLFVHPISFFETKNSLSIPNDSEFVSLRKHSFFVDTGSAYSCFSSVVISKLAEHNENLSTFSPIFTHPFAHGNSMDIGFEVNMWIKIGDFEPFAHGMILGCPSRISSFAKGIIGKDLIANLNLSYKAATEKRNGSLVYFHNNKLTRNDRNFLFIGSDARKLGKYYIPSPFPMLDIYNLTRKAPQHLRDRINTNFWNYNQNYDDLINSKQLSNIQLRAMLSVATFSAIALTDDPLPAARSHQFLLGSGQLEKVTMQHLIQLVPEPPIPPKEDSGLVESFNGDYMRIRHELDWKHFKNASRSAWESIDSFDVWLFK